MSEGGGLVKGVMGVEERGGEGEWVSEGGGLVKGGREGECRGNDKVAYQTKVGIFPRIVRPHVTLI